MVINYVRKKKRFINRFGSNRLGSIIYWILYLCDDAFSSTSRMACGEHIVFLNRQWVFFQGASCFIANVRRYLGCDCKILAVEKHTYKDSFDAFDICIFGGVRDFLYDGLYAKRFSLVISKYFLNHTIIAVDLEKK